MNLLQALALTSLAAIAATASCTMDRAPGGLRRTPAGPGATVRFDLSHRPLPDIPLPNDTATWPDPTSRTGLRINASLVAPTNIEAQARARFSELEGWGTFAPISVSFDIPREGPYAKDYEGYEGAALDLENVIQRHQGDDYEFNDDAVYLVNLTTGVPLVIDVGAGNFDYTLKRLDKYWPNDTRVTERNLLFETIDESRRGEITPAQFLPEHDTDFDGVLDRANLDQQDACPGPDPVCDSVGHDLYESPDCLVLRRARDRCVADHLMYWYERETDTLILRPLLPMDEMTRYAVVITDRTVDGAGNAVKSPFDFIYHASMEGGARRVMEILNDTNVRNYYGDLHGTGLDHVAFTWTFTTQPTVDDMKRLRDGLYGRGPFARWEQEFPAQFELQRAVGLTPGLTEGNTDVAGWETSTEGVDANCPAQVNSPNNLYIIKYDELRSKMRQLVVEGFGVNDGPAVEALLRSFEHVDSMVIGTFRSPFLLEGGAKSTDPNAAFHVNYQTGEGEVTEDIVPFWLIIPKETAQFKKPFNVNIYGHGYTGFFAEQLLYAGNMAEHGLATIGINAMGHGVVFDTGTASLAKTLFGSGCVGPFYDALTTVRARDLNRDGIGDSGGDFWSSYLFHTRDGVRQSVLDHIQLVRILRSFGSGGRMMCRTEQKLINGMPDMPDPTTGWDKPATQECDFNGDGKPELAGDFDGDGVVEVGGVSATYGTWGESLGGILSAIHGAVDAHVTAAVPGSGGGGLTDIGVRSFQGGVIEAVLLRMWGPLLVSVPASERPVCGATSKEDDHCTVCAAEEVTVRWVVPDLNGTGEVEIACLSPGQIADTTVLVQNLSNGELRCASVDDELRFRIGLPSSIGDEVDVSFLAGKHQVESYGSCRPLLAPGATSILPQLSITTWGKGRFGDGATNAVETDTCTSPSCTSFQGIFYGEGTALTAPAEGFGQIRQTPALRRFLQLAQAALEPGDPISFAPFYSIKPMTDPYDAVIAPHALLTLNTIGDMNVPLNAGIAFARASGALPFITAEQASRYPEYANYAAPEALRQALGRTPNQDLIDNHVIEGISALGRHPASAECAASQNAKGPQGTYLTQDGEVKLCYPTGCTEQTETSENRVCLYDMHCELTTGTCVPNALGQRKCDEALWDPDDLDEGAAKIFEQSSPIPLRLARHTQPATPGSLDDVWAPRVLGVPFGNDGSWKPDGRPLTALLDAYIVPEGEHTFVNGEPCQSFDKGTYLTNLVAQFFMTNGRDLYYLSHPTTHHCLGSIDVEQCGYLNP